MIESIFIRLCQAVRHISQLPQAKCVACLILRHAERWTDREVIPICQPTYHRHKTKINMTNTTEKGHLWFQIFYDLLCCMFYTTLSFFIQVYFYFQFIIFFSLIPIQTLQYVLIRKCNPHTFLDLFHFPWLAVSISGSLFWEVGLLYVTVPFHSATGQDRKFKNVFTSKYMKEVQTKMVMSFYLYSI